MSDRQAEIVIWAEEMRAAFLRMDGLTLPCEDHRCDWTPCVLRRALVRTGRAIARSARRSESSDV